MLAHRDARLLLAGQTLSVFGDRAMFLALGVWVKTLTGSSAAAGLVFFAYTAPGLVSPLFGVVVDRARARPLMIGLNLAGAAVLIPLIGVHGRGQLWLIYLVALLYGAIGWLFYSAQSAYLTRLLPPELLGDANAALQTTGEGMRLFAPLVGAALFAAFGGPTVAALDAATFVVAAATLWLVHHRERRPAPSEHHLRAQVAAGARHIARSEGLRRIVAATAACLLVVGFSETLIFSVIQHGLHRPPTFFGVLSTAQGGGAIAGGLVAGTALRRHGDGRVMGIGMLLFAVGEAGLLVPHTAVVLAGFAVAGTGIALAVVGYFTAVQLRTPADLQGRVNAAADMLVGVPQTVSIALGAALVGIVDYRLLIAVMSVVTAGCGVYLLTAHLPPPTDGLVPAGDAR
ncbi:MAG TPA: MFS transporter [Gaiellales bacterium]